MPHDDVPLTDWPAELDPDHIAYLTARAVTPAVARARGYASLKAGRRSASLDGSYSTMLGLGPHGGLLIPLRGILAPDGEDRQIRLPDGAGDKKFLTPAGQSPVLVTHPATVAAVTEDADSPLIVAEGVTRVDALAAYGIPAVGILGCYGWRGIGRLGAHPATGAPRHHRAGRRRDDEPACRRRRATACADAGRPGSDGSRVSGPARRTRPR